MSERQAASKQSGPARHQRGGRHAQRGGRPPARPPADRGATATVAEGAARARLLERADVASDEEALAAANRQAALRWCAGSAGLVGVLAGAVVLVVVWLAAGVLAGVLAGAVVLVAVAVGGARWAWRGSAGRVLRALGAVPSVESERPRVHNLVEGLCATVGVPVPEVWVVSSPVPNAMAVGRDPDSAALVVTTALEASLSLVELEGVLAHELVHVKRRDTLLGQVAVVLCAPLAVLGLADPETVHARVGRGRELAADRRAIALVRYPPGLAGALAGMSAGTPGAGWPPGRGRTAALTQWLWVDPVAGALVDEVGNLDHTAVRTAVLDEY